MISREWRFLTDDDELKLPSQEPRRLIRSADDYARYLQEVMFKSAAEVAQAVLTIRMRLVAAKVAKILRDGELK